MVSKYITLYYGDMTMHAMKSVVVKLVYVSKSERIPLKSSIESTHGQTVALCKLVRKSYPIKEYVY